ncbi:unnamed protein product [Onchocerca flexuosa]|uniref:G_PROTEIN_RECEP_F1_2 domain-containing protein n=1 Tax=Onchocerca flexuosa TaxID=387005 RepID=A0A183HT86_9BILA|nr:unnamed protein product [Onchocerca flexuosa]
MAGFDLSLIFILTDIRPVSGCSAFPCFTSEEFRTYWGMSNMIVNLLSCILTVFVAMLLKTRKTRKLTGSNAMLRKKEDKLASRASFYILIVSAIFGVVPGGINGCAQRIQSDVSLQQKI